MSPGPRPRRGGFTLVEIAVVLLVVGILTGLALPNFREAVARADAAHVMSDVATIRNAAYRHLIAEGSFPSPGAWGEIPPEMEDELPDGYAFEYKGMRYRWYGFSFSFEILGSTELGFLMIDLRNHPPIARALRSHAGTWAYWSPSTMWFIYRG